MAEDAWARKYASILDDLRDATRRMRQGEGAYVREPQSMEHGRDAVRKAGWQPREGGGNG